jgi:hypothetical protein
MTICRDRMPLAADLAHLNNNYPVVQVRLRVRWNDLSRFLDLYHTYFLPVDLRTRQVLWFLHEYRTHFNLTFLYRYTNWEGLINFTGSFAREWALVHRSKDTDAAQRDIEEKEADMNSMIEDEERLLFIEFRGSNWTSSVA